MYFIIQDSKTERVTKFFLSPLKYTLVQFHRCIYLTTEENCKWFQNIFGNECSLFVSYRGVLNQMDPGDYSASSTTWEYRNWTWQICLEKTLCTTITRPTRIATLALPIFLCTEDRKIHLFNHMPIDLRHLFLRLFTSASCVPIQLFWKKIIATPQAE